MFSQRHSADSSHLKFINSDNLLNKDYKFEIYKFRQLTKIKTINLKFIRKFLKRNLNKKAPNYKYFVFFK